MICFPCYCCGKRSFKVFFYIQFYVFLTFVRFIYLLTFVVVLVASSLPYQINTKKSIFIIMKAIHLFYEQVFENYEYINTDKRADIIKQATEAAQELCPKFTPTQREIDFAVSRAVEQLNFENDIRYN